MPTFDPNVFDYNAFNAEWPIASGELAAIEAPDSATLFALRGTMAEFDVTEESDTVAIIGRPRAMRRPPHPPERPRSYPPNRGAVDVRLVQNTLFPKYPPIGSVTIDWALREDGTLDDTQALATAVVVALGTDRLAELGDELPDPDSNDRRGWWGDVDPDVWDSWPIGSRLWTLQRSKIEGPGSARGATVVRVEHYIREAIQPFLDRRIGSRMEVEATRVDQQRIDALVRIFRGPDLEIDLRYQIAWAGILRQGGEYDIGEAVNPL